MLNSLIRNQNEFCNIVEIRNWKIFPKLKLYITARVQYHDCQSEHISFKRIPKKSFAMCATICILSRRDLTGIIKSG